MNPARTPPAAILVGPIGPLGASGDLHAILRAQIASLRPNEIVTMVHAHLWTKDARDRFEGARHSLSHNELVDLATRALEGASDAHSPRR